MRHLSTFASDLLRPEGATLFSWSPTGELLAAAGLRKKVVLFDRAGDVVASLTLPDPETHWFEPEQEAPVLQLSWHPSGSHLAILPRGQSFAMVWSSSEKETARVDSGIKPAEVSSLCWHPQQAQLAVGTVKGSAIMFDFATRAATPLALGRAPGGKPICCMAWSTAATPGGLLALGCKSGSLLLCRAADGGLVKSLQLKGTVSQLQFASTQMATEHLTDGQKSSISSSRNSSSRGGSSRGSSSSTQLEVPAPDGGDQLSAVIGKRTLWIWQLPQALAPDAGGAFELALRDGYGDLEHYCWLHPRLLAVGFSSGQLVAVSLSSRSGLQPGAGSGTELFSSRCLQQGVAAMSWCPATAALAAGSGCELAMLNCQVPNAVAEEEASTLELEAGQRVASLQFSPDGRLLTVATTAGRLLQLLARPPLLHASWGGRMAYVDPACSSSQALLVEQGQQQQAQQPLSPVALPLPVEEPDLLALGPYHLAAALGSKVWLQALEPDASTALLPPPVESCYPANISWLRLNQACVLLLADEGRVFVQPVDTAEGDIAELRGNDDEPFSATCAALTEHFILLGLPDGTVAFYQCDDMQLVSQYEHSGGGIAAMYPNAAGTIVLFQDTSGGMFVYDAVSNDLMQPPSFSGTLQVALWDAADAAVVMACNDTGLAHIYCHIPCSVQGSGLKLVGTQQGPKGATPLALHAGLLTWHLPDGSLEVQLLSTHEHLAQPVAGSSARGSRRSGSGKGQQLLLLGGRAEGSGAVMSREEQLTARCQQALALSHFPQALEAARQLGDTQLLREVGLAALQLLEVATAVAAHEAAGDDETARQLRPLLDIQDDNLLMGRIIAITGGNADHAEELLLASSCPSAAIDMRKQLGHWERALELAEQLEPDAVGSLALLRAEALEAEGQAEAAMAMYQQALAAPDFSAESVASGSEQRSECQAGIARCSILLGDIEQGMELAIASGSTQLLLQCAELLEAEQQFKQAGQLYARAGQHERAAQLFLSCREFGLLDSVMGSAGSPELWLQYAQAKEDLGSFADAARAFEQAGATLAAVHVYLERLNDAEAAAELAQRAQSAEASIAVARFCERAGKLELAQEQYCIGGQYSAAFQLAQRSSSGVSRFASWARQADNAEAALLAAGHYEAQQQWAASAELYALAGKHERAARLFIQAGADSLPAAIMLAGEVQDPAVAAVVVEHLQALDSMGSALLDLHMKLGSYEQACAVAVARAQKEQAAGNYKAARDQLLRVCLDLQQQGAHATPDLLSALSLLHSYLLVRTLVRQGDHLAAARLLLRVADNIQAFPKHIVAILTSAVIECHRAALHGPAQRWAAVLMQPQHVGQVSAAYAKKIEAIAKQPAWTAEKKDEEPQSDCLFCGVPGPDTSLSCSACQKALPFCAASGKRMVLSDWSECPGCRFPCRGRDMTRVAAMEHACPMCESQLTVHSVKKIFDPVAQMRRTVFGGMVQGSRKERC